MKKLMLSIALAISGAACAVQPVQQHHQDPVTECTALLQKLAQKKLKGRDQVRLHTLATQLRKRKIELEKKLVTGLLSSSELDELNKIYNYVPYL
jgi:hypothetical protein